MKRRLSVALATIGDPKFLVLGNRQQAWILLTGAQFGRSF